MDDSKDKPMPSLLNYIQPGTLMQLQRSFCKASNAVMSICDADGTERLIDPCDENPQPENADSFQAPVFVDENIVARVVMWRSECDCGDLQSLADLAADVLGRMAGQQKQLRTRAEELATLYRLTAEFTGVRDLQGVLDLVTRTVVDVLQAKSCAIRLLNDDRNELIVKAMSNLSPEYLDKGPILLSESLIDQEVLSELKSVVVDDYTVDARVVYPREAMREGIVSALCCPMVYQGRAEGVLRIYTSQKREFDWFTISLAEAIASEAAAAIVNSRLNEEALRASNMQRHMRMAATVQRRMIPDEAPHVPGFDFGTVYVPCFDLGGDFYDFFDLGDNALGISVCDVAGKGVRASLLMASVRASLRAHAADIYELSEVIEKVNRDLCTSTEVGDFATLFYGILDTNTREFTYVNAGHVSPLLVRDGKVRRLSRGGMVLGVLDDASWNHESVNVEQGDVILCFTDGLTDAANFEEERFGDKRVEDAILTAAEKGFDADGIAKHVLWEMRRFAGLSTRSDDLTIVAIKAT